MRLRKLPCRKMVTVGDLLLTSDRNEAKHSVMEAVDNVTKDIRRITSIFIVAEVDGEELMTHSAGFSGMEIVYIADLMKMNAMRDQQISSSEYDDEEEDKGK
jgi:hypothetical protein